MFGMYNPTRSRGQILVAWLVLFGAFEIRIELFVTVCTKSVFQWIRCTAPRPLSQFKSCWHICVLVTYDLRDFLFFQICQLLFFRKVWHFTRWWPRPSYILLISFQTKGANGSYWGWKKLFFSLFLQTLGSPVDQGATILFHPHWLLCPVTFLGHGWI